MTIDNLFINEIYRTYQGEGPYMGHPATFVRTQFCPVGCTWCDTKFTWEFDATKEVSNDELLERIKSVGTDHIVFTGGEPLAQKKALENFVVLLPFPKLIEIETSGVYGPMYPRLAEGGGIFHYNISVKPPSAATKIPMTPGRVSEFKEMPYGDRCWKFVVADQKDLDWVVDFTKKHKFDEPNKYTIMEEVYLMPEGVSEWKIQQNLKFLWNEAPKVLPRARITPRMHIQVWGNKRKV